MIKTIAIILISSLITSVSLAQKPTGFDRCLPCERPGALASQQDSVMDVKLADGSVLRNIRSAVRTTHEVLGRKEQAIRLTWLDTSGMCRDTTLAAESVEAFLHEGIGGTHSPVVYPVSPAREIYRESGAHVNRSFAEIYGLLGYGGTDTTSRKIGFSSFYGSIEAVIAPFGTLLGDYLSLGAGGGILFEGGRMRFPLFAQLRFSFPTSERVETVSAYIPDDCHFSIPGSHDSAHTLWKDYTERSFSRTDAGVLFTTEKGVVAAALRPYIYLEGGTVFDGNFDGAGTPDNVVNPNYRKPLLLGGGIGAVIGPWLTVALGYRYMQLHLATPCEQCVDRTIINRNEINSITLKAGYRLSW